MTRDFKYISEGSNKKLSTICQWWIARKVYGSYRVCERVITATTNWGMATTKPNIIATVCHLSDILTPLEAERLLTITSYCYPPIYIRGVGQFSLYHKYSVTKQLRFSRTEYIDI